MAFIPVPFQFQISKKAVHAPTTQFPAMLLADMTPTRRGYVVSAWLVEG